jgi:hypothetical protein
MTKTTWMAVAVGAVLVAAVGPGCQRADLCASSVDCVLGDHCGADGVCLPANPALRGSSAGQIMPGAVIEFLPVEAAFYDALVIADATLDGTVAGRTTTGAAEAYRVDNGAGTWTWLTIVDEQSDGDWSQFAFTVIGLPSDALKEDGVVTVRPDELGLVGDSVACSEALDVPVDEAIIEVETGLTDLFGDTYTRVTIQATGQGTWFVATLMLLAV